MRRFLTTLAVLAAIAAAAIYFFPEWTKAPAEPSYRLAKVDRGEIVAAVNATGTINPTTTVIVGSQLSGQVVEILADYNSQVKAGQVVARLNADQIRARLDAARADLDQMRATKLVQEATIERVKADIARAHATQTDVEAQVARHEVLLADAERNVQRQSELRTRGIAAEATFDTARTTRDAQRSAVESARAQVASAKAQLLGLAADLQVAEAQVQAVTAQIAQREAAVRQIEVDLRNSEIRSPVSGTVVQRSIELGQTVAASLQAPTLFLIADDLRRMEIAASIDETDVGRLKPGQRVSFTVNAYPGRNFEGEVKLVRLGSQVVQNVVIYTAIIAVANPRMELMPGMTANLRIETDRRDEALRVPNAALRWRPADAPAAAEAASASAAPEGEAGPSPGAGRGMAALAEALKTELKLDSTQQKAVDAAIEEARARFAALRGPGSEPGARRGEARTIRSELDERLVAVLSPEQRPKLQEIRRRLAEERGTRGTTQSGRVFVVGADGKPQAMAVRLGASDGGVTEVVSGDIEAGNEVIIGGGPRPEAAAAARARTRFGF